MIENKAPTFENIRKNLRSRWVFPSAIFDTLVFNICKQELHYTQRIKSNWISFKFDNDDFNIGSFSYLVEKNISESDRYVLTNDLPKILEKYWCNFSWEISNFGENKQLKFTSQNKILIRELLKHIHTHYPQEFTESVKQYELTNFNYAMEIFTLLKRKKLSPSPIRLEIIEQSLKHSGKSMTDLNPNRSEERTLWYLEGVTKSFMIAVVRKIYDRLLHWKIWHMRDDTPDVDIEEYISSDLQGDYAYLDASKTKSSQEMKLLLDQAKNIWWARKLFTGLFRWYYSLISRNIPQDLMKYKKWMNQHIKASWRGYGILDYDWKKSDKEMKKIFLDILKKTKMSAIEHAVDRATFIVGKLKNDPLVDPFALFKELKMVLLTWGIKFEEEPEELQQEIQKYVSISIVKKAILVLCWDECTDKPWLYFTIKQYMQQTWVSFSDIDINKDPKEFENKLYNLVYPYKMLNSGT